MNKFCVRVFWCSLVLVFVFLSGMRPNTVLGKTQQPLSVSGWIPYWHDVLGVADAQKNLDHFNTLHPFGFAVKTDGSLRDLTVRDGADWASLFTAARAAHVELIPSVMWSNGAHIQKVLSSTSTRQAHINAIVAMVQNGRYDGVDIDYEGKLSKTKDLFSTFLRELKQKLGDKILTCAVEPRIPPNSLYTVISKTLAYSNDYRAIGTWCDRVELMAYDQGRSDLLLDKVRRGQPYMPVADPDWVRKIITHALKDIPREKIMIGIPTYGYQYTVTVAPDWYKKYTRISAINIADAEALALRNNATSSRNSAGELSFTYMPTTTRFTLPSNLVLPKGTPKGNIVAARALAYANKTGKTITFNMVSYTDATAITSKINLAREYGLRGITFFKIDGEEDPALRSESLP